MKLDSRIQDNEKVLFFYSIKDNCYKLYNSYTDFTAIWSNINGPAVICASGQLEYWFNDKFLGLNLTKKEFNIKMKELVFK